MIHTMSMNLPLTHINTQFEVVCRAHSVHGVGPGSSAMNRFACIQQMRSAFHPMIST